MKKAFNTPLARFRTIAIAEGISFLVLLFVAMPLKYFAGHPEAVLVVGWLHGILFIAYMLAGLEVRKALNWDRKKVLFAVFAFLVPFGPFILEKRLLRQYES